MSTNNKQYQFIDTPEQLQELCQNLQGSSWLTLDTEFIREKTYYPQLCLLQIANEEHVACVDTLTLKSLTPLLDLIYNPDITKIFHAAHQDVEILFHLTGKVPEDIFDTQIAASLLGLGEQIGYGNLVDNQLGIQLDKGHSRTDWSLRPLDDAQLHYAANDVIYLRDIYHTLSDELSRLGRLEWLTTDFAKLSDPEKYSNHPEDMWRKVKDGRRLKGIQLAMLQDLAAWREQIAINKDRPRRWIIKDDVLAELARTMPADNNKMGRIRGLEEATIRRYGTDLLAIIDKSRSRPKESWPVLPKIKRLAPGQDAVIDAMMALVRLLAADANLSPGMLASKKDLEQLILSGTEKSSLLHGWRRSVIGEPLLALLDGTTSLQIKNGLLSHEKT